MDPLGKKMTPDEASRHITANLRAQQKFRGVPGQEPKPQLSVCRGSLSGTELNQKRATLPGKLLDFPFFTGMGLWKLFPLWTPSSSVDLIAACLINWNEQIASKAENHLFL